MIRSHAEYRKKLRLYVSALNAWGFSDSHVIDKSDYHSVMLEMFDRALFIITTYNDLLNWTRPRRPWLAVDNPGLQPTPSRGISAPIKPPELIQLEKDIEYVFNIELKDAASTAWKDADVSVKEPGTRAWTEATRARLTSHIMAESRRLAEQLDENEVLVLPNRINTYEDTKTRD